MSVLAEIISIVTPRRHKPVFPAYIALRIRDAARIVLAAADYDYPGAAVDGDIESLGCSRYMFQVVDGLGTTYRVTVEIDGRGPDPCADSTDPSQPDAVIA